MEFNRKYEFVTVPYSNQWNQKINYISENKHNLMRIQYTGNPADDAEFVEKKIQQARGKDIMIFQRYMDIMDWIKRYHNFC